MIRKEVFSSLDKATHPDILVLLLLPPVVKLRSQRLAEVLLRVAQLLDPLVQALHKRFGDNNRGYIFVYFWNNHYTITITI